MGGDWNPKWGTLDVKTGKIHVASDDNAHAKDEHAVTMKACLDAPYVNVCSPVLTFKVRIDHCLITSFKHSKVTPDITKEVFIGASSYPIADYI
jgi:hypothetical protein